MRIAIVLALALALGACGARQSPNTVDADDAIVLIKSNVVEANVYVDGRYYGSVRMLRGGLAFEAGKHRLELRHEDYFSRYVELDLKRAERQSLELDLAPVLP
jgi:hypothetical protein